MNSNEIDAKIKCAMTPRKLNDNELDLFNKHICTYLMNSEYDIKCIGFSYDGGFPFFYDEEKKWDEYISGFIKLNPKLLNVTNSSNNAIFFAVFYTTLFLPLTLNEISKSKDINVIDTIHGTSIAFEALNAYCLFNENYNNLSKKLIKYLQNLQNTFYSGDNELILEMQKSFGKSINEKVQSRYRNLKKYIGNDKSRIFVEVVEEEIKEYFNLKKPYEKILLKALDDKKCTESRLHGETLIDCIIKNNLDSLIKRAIKLGYIQKNKSKEESDMETNLEKETTKSDFLPF